MKKSLLTIALLAPLTVGLTGCVVAVGSGEDRVITTNDFEDRERENRKKIAKLQVNESYDSVRSNFGLADFNESYEKDGVMIQVLYYRTHRVHKDDLTTKDECTPLIFIDGKLTSWGEKAYSQL